MFNELVWSVLDASDVDNVQFPSEDLLEQWELFDSVDRNRMRWCLEALAYDFMLIVEESRILSPELRQHFHGALFLGRDLLLKNFKPPSSQKL